MGTEAKAGQAAYALAVVNPGFIPGPVIRLYFDFAAGQRRIVGIRELLAKRLHASGRSGNQYALAIGKNRQPVNIVTLGKSV
jgi:hypothetical protein